MGTGRGFFILSSRLYNASVKRRAEATTSPNA
jgi:hypothetical protein